MIIDLKTDVQTLEFKAGNVALSFVPNDENLEKFEKAESKLKTVTDAMSLKEQRKAAKGFVDSIFKSGDYDKLYVACGNSTALTVGAIAKIALSIKQSVEDQVIAADDEVYVEFLKAKSNA